MTSIILVALLNLHHHHRHHHHNHRLVYRNKSLGLYLVVCTFILSKSNQKRVYYN